MEDNTAPPVSKPVKILSWALIYLLSVNPFIHAVAQGIQVDVNAAANNQATLDTAANGVPVVNIANPSAKGVSHNKFQRFNVGANGVVINNSRQITNTQLAGFISGNTNLSKSARIILNEVTHDNPSQLLGFTEIAGPSARYILANPYGITCNGCGFINTPHATLTTGKPDFLNGDLKSFSVDDGTVAIEGLGLNANSVDRFDIFARAVSLSAAVHAKDLNIVTGRNDVAFNTSSLGEADIQAKADNASTKPTFALDASALGSLNANQIFLIGTEQGLGVNMLGDVASTVGDITLKADGTISLNKVNAAKDLSVTSVQGNIELKGNVHAENLNIEARGAGGTVDVAAVAEVAAQRQLAINAKTLDQKGTLAAGREADGETNTLGNLALTVDQINNLGIVDSSNDLSVIGDSLVNNGVLVARNDLTINLTGALNNNSGAGIAANNLQLYSDTLTNHEGARLYAANDLVIAKDNGLGKNTKVENISGSIEAANGDLTVATAKLSNRRQDLVINTTTSDVGAAEILSEEELYFYDPVVAAWLNSLAPGGKGIAKSSWANYWASRYLNRLDTIPGVSIPAATRTRLINTIVADSNTTNTGTYTARASGIIDYIVNDLSNSEPQQLETIKTYLQSELASTQPTFNGFGNVHAADWNDDRDVHVYTHLSYQAGSVTKTTIDKDASSAAAVISAGGDITLRANTLNNSHSDILAGKDAYLEGVNLNNTGTNEELSATRKSITRNYHNNDLKGQTTQFTTQVKSLGTVPSRIHAEGNLTAVFTNEINNSSIKQGVTYQSPGSAAINGANVADLSATDSQPTFSAPIEVNSAFTTYNNFIGSGYLLTRLGYDPEGNLNGDAGSKFTTRRLGDSFYELRLVRDQIFEATNKRYLNPAYVSDSEQFQALMDNALAAHQSLQLSLGVALTTEQVALLSNDIVWLQEQQVAGQTVLVPTLYLADATRSKSLNQAASISGDNVTLQAGNINNSGAIVAVNDLTLTSQQSVTNTEGDLVAGKSLKIDAEDDIGNLSGRIQGGTVALNAKGDITNKTLSQETERSGSYKGVDYKTISSTVASTAQIISTDGDVTLNAGENIRLTAAELKAKGDASLNAGGDIVADTVALRERTEANWDKGRHTEDATNHLTSLIETGGTLNLNSGQDIVLKGTQVNAEQDINLSAQRDIQIESVANTFELDHFHESTSGRGKTSRKASRVTQAGGVLQADGDIRINIDKVDNEAGEGSLSVKESRDVILSGSSLTAAGDVLVYGGGDVTLQSVENSDSSYYKKTTKKLLSKSSKESNQSSITQMDSRIIAGQDAVIISGRDINVLASTVAADENIQIQADGDINIESRQNRYFSLEAESSSSIGSGLTGLSIESAAHEQGKTSIVQAGASLKADNIELTANRDIKVVASKVEAASDATLKAGGDVQLLAAQDITNEYYEADSSQVTLGGINTNLGASYSKSTTDNTRDSSVARGSEVNAGGDLSIRSDSNIIAQGASLRSGGLTTLDAANDVLLVASRDSRIQSTETDGTAWGGEIGSEWESGGSYVESEENTDGTQVVNNATRINAGEGLVIRSGGNTLLEATDIIVDADREIDINAGGDLTFATVSDIDSYSESSNSSATFWEKNKGEGYYTEAIRHVRIRGSNKIKLAVGDGITVQYRQGHEGEGYKELVTALAAEDPTLAWMTPLLDRDDVDWQAIAQAHEEWDYDTQNLSGVGALVVVVIVTYFTAGAGSGIGGAVGGAAEGAAVSAGAVAGGSVAAAAGTAATAAVASLASQAAVSLINNQGDLGAVLDELGSSDAAKNILTSVVTAGVLEGLSKLPGVQGLAEGAGKLGSLDSLQYGLYEAGVRASVDTAVNGGSLSSNLEGALTNAFVNWGAQGLTNGIGDNGAVLGGDGSVTKALAHALVGCISAEGLGGDCGSGATGAAVAELLSPWLAANGHDNPTDELVLKVVTSVVAGVAHQDVDTAVAAGLQVERYNRLNHTQQRQAAEALDACETQDCINKTYQQAKVLADEQNGYTEEEQAVYDTAAEKIYGDLAANCDTNACVEFTRNRMLMLSLSCGTVGCMSEEALEIRTAQKILQDQWGSLALDAVLDVAVVAGSLLPLLPKGSGTASAGVGDDVVNNTVKALPAPDSFAKHHIFNVFRGKSPKSQKYRDFFKKHNIALDDHTIKLTQLEHKQVHKAGNNWTTQWKRWIDANPSATTREVYQQAGRMMDAHGVGHKPIIKY